MFVELVVNRGVRYLLKIYSNILVGLFSLIVVTSNYMPREVIADKWQYNVALFQELDNLIMCAVHDESWMYAKSPEETKEILSKYYAEPLLSKLTMSCWEFIEEPTDWYSKTSLEFFDIMENRDNEASGRVVVRIEDVDTGKSENIKGFFIFRRQSGKWKVYDYHYVWNPK